jgi:murein DD-endopeptidase MepM/ murein hydrolase activator NlpD
MRSTRYTILIANRKSGAVRRLTISRRIIGVALFVVVALPTLVLLGSRGASRAELEVLEASNESLRIENDSYRDATGELTVQIASLQAALSQLSEQAELDSATKAAIAGLPAVIRSRAMGGGSTTSPIPQASAAPATSPESTFGILRGLLGSLENGLASVKSRVENQQALARATPSGWPVIGWLTSTFGNRRDPFTGQADFHTGLDISANAGTPVRATADGTIESTGYQGNYGNAIVVAHGFGIATRFGHLSRFAVRPGQKVKRGEVIGYVGATGRATSAHLHYEILVNGQPLNPFRLLTRP